MHSTWTWTRMPAYRFPAHSHSAWFFVRALANSFWATAIAAAVIGPPITTTGPTSFIEGNDQLFGVGHLCGDPAPRAATGA